MLFISHASADDGFVAELREALEALQIPVWVDSRNLRGGSKLAPEIETAIAEASHFLAVLSPSTVNSPWVRREIRKALKVEQARQVDGYRLIPLLLPGISPQALENWFDEEPLGVKVEVGPGGLSAALPALLAALGKCLSTDYQPFEQPDARPVEELVLTLTDPRFETEEAGIRRAKATATLEYFPADPRARSIESRRYTFTAPLGPIEKDDLRWYLESYHLWPVGVFKERAQGIEQKLPAWGWDLFQAAFGAKSPRAALTAWEQAADGAERRFSVQVNSDLPEGASEETQAAAREAATELLALPWEILRDGSVWLFQGRYAARVRRRLPNRHAHPARPTALPIRILHISPRPEKNTNGDPITYIDHRISALPLSEAVEDLGVLARLTFLNPPTYGALEESLRVAADYGQPFDVIHFDGYGVYDPRLGLRGLCFEDPNDDEKLRDRMVYFVDATQLAGLVRQYRIPLVFLQAYQTAVADMYPTASSVATRLLEEGVTSVVAMSYSVMLETARRFTQAFYGELARGARVGRAMLTGQQALFADNRRGKVLGAGDLRLQDWFLPVLYQEKQDPQLITQIPLLQIRKQEAQKRRLSFGHLPEPRHQFRGRSPELLALERLLKREPWAVMRGLGGQGKTILAAELARWLVRTGRFSRAAFVSLDRQGTARAVLETLGRQLLGPHHAIAESDDLDSGLQPVVRALADRPTILVLDNCESVMPERTGPAAALSPQDAAAAIFSLCQRLLEADPRTRLVFTTREPLPAPFNAKKCERELGALDPLDAVELVSEVMKQNGWTPPSDDAGRTPQEITDLVEAVSCHARALVLLAREVALHGVEATTRDLRSLMTDLERKYAGDRENSLYASVELSLRRLSAESREHIRSLAACHGGVHLAILGMLTGLEPGSARQLAIELMEVGLAEDMGFGHLRLDPGLPPYLLGGLTVDIADELRSRWAEAMAELTGYLYQELFKKTQLAAQLPLLELPNLLAMLDWAQAHWLPERLVDLADRVEKLLTELGRPQALTRVTWVREQAAKNLGGWSHARYLTESVQIDRLLERGDLRAAHAAAQQLLAKSLAASEITYPEAAFDNAHVHFLLGRVLKMGGEAEAALTPLAEAQRRFQELAEAGNKEAELMFAVLFTEIGDCLTALGRLDKAAVAYEERLRHAPSTGDLRGAAVAKFQLGAVRRQQERYKEALEIYTEARKAFEELGEPRMVATALRQIGRVYEEAGQFEPAEQAYRQSLAINVRENDLVGQASSLNQLGTFYYSDRRFEEAVVLHKQAAQLRARLGDVLTEGRSRNNLALALVALKRYDEARQELQRAIECNRPFGHTVSPWTTWAILEDLERATGHAEEAQAARQQAIETYLAYRRAGGVSQSGSDQLRALIVQGIQQNTEGAVRQVLDQVAAKPDTPPVGKALIARLQAVLAGDRNPALADDPELDFKDAAELQLLLESLGQDSPESEPE